jgi:hypothetical protein
MTAKEKAAAGLWLLKQAVFDLLSQPENRNGMIASQVRDALGLVTKDDEGTGVATGLLKLMTADGELESTGERHPSYSLPANSDKK